MKLAKLFPLILCNPLVACDLLDMEEGMTSSADTGGEDPGDEDPGVEATGGEDPSADESTGGADPSAGENPYPAGDNLVGTWFFGNEETHLEMLDLFSNSTYQEEREGQGDNAGCWTVYNLQISGEYYVEDDVLTLHPTTTHLFVDECGTVTVSEDVHPDAVFWFERSADEYGQTLILTPQDGSAVLEYHLL